MKYVVVLHVRGGGDGKRKTFQLLDFFFVLLETRQYLPSEVAEVSLPCGRCCLKVIRVSS